MRRGGGGLGADHRISFWDAADGQAIRSFQAPTTVHDTIDSSNLDLSDAEMLAVLEALGHAVAPDGSGSVLGGADGRITLWARLPDPLPVTESQGVAAAAA